MRRKIGLRELKALRPGQTVWDSEVVGLHVRRQRGDRVFFTLYYRTREGRRRWMSLGPVGAPHTPDTARREAQRLLGLVATGVDPAAERVHRRNAPTVSELADQYLKAAEAGQILLRGGYTKKLTTVASDRSRIK